MKNLLERQDYPDPALTTYDDSGWSMGYAFNVDVKEMKEKSIRRRARRRSRPPSCAAR